MFNPSEALPFLTLSGTPGLLPRFSLRINCRCSLLFSVSFSRFPPPQPGIAPRRLLPALSTAPLKGCLNRIPLPRTHVKRFFGMILINLRRPLFRAAAASLPCPMLAQSTQRISSIISPSRYSTFATTRPYIRTPATMYILSLLIAVSHLKFGAISFPSITASGISRETLSAGPI